MSSSRIVKLGYISFVFEMNTLEFFLEATHLICQKDVTDNISIKKMGQDVLTQEVML